MFDHIFPRENVTDLEVALDAQEARVLAIPVPIREAFKPYETPAAVLPFLAWEKSVDIWNDAWPDAKKRAVTAAAFRLHKRKGTAYAVREYVRYAGGTVTGLITPPKKVFSGPSLTRDEREAWLSRLPQVRTWRIRDAVQPSPIKAFHGGQRRGHFCEFSYSIPSTALQRLKRRARYVVDGIETEVRVSDFGGYFRLHRPSTERAHVFSNRPFGLKRFFIPSDARSRLVTIQPTPRQPWQSALGPTLQPVTAEPERVTVSGTAGRRVFSGLGFGKRFFAPSTAVFRIFQRYAVHDGRKVLRRPSLQFMGIGRYGWPAHTARVTASVPGRRAKCAAGDGIVMPKLRFWVPSNVRERVETICRAVQSAKRLSDRILLKTGIDPKFIAGRPFLAGTPFIVGLPN